MAEIFITVKAGDTIGPITITADLPLPAGTTVLAQLRDVIGRVVTTWRSSDGTAVINGADVTLQPITATRSEPWPEGRHGFEVQITEDGTTTTEIRQEDLAIEVLGDGAYV